MLIQNNAPVSGKKKKPESEIPQQDVESLARILLPQIQKYFESENGQREFDEWEKQQEQKSKNRAET